MNTPINLTNHFLIAMPQLDDPNFFQSVTFICQHNDEGAMGIIVNHPTMMQLSDIFAQMGINSDTDSVNQLPVYCGGPVLPEHGFILHRAGKNWADTLFISNDIALTTSSDILTDIASNQGPRDCLIALGYAGWGAGQLEQEIRDNAWLSVPATADIIFSRPVEQRWAAAAALLGIDINLLSEEVGHA